LFVEPMYRSQGIGGELVRRLCAEFQDTGGRQLCHLYVATDRPDFFRPFGLEEVSSRHDIPLPLKLTSGQICMKGHDQNEISDDASSNGD